jgi:hypothetical protein
MKVIENINEFLGRVPVGHDLVVMEKGDLDSALVLMGFDEIGMFDNMFKKPVYAFLEQNYV